MKLLSFFLLLISLNIWATNLNPRELLIKSDQARGGLNHGVRWKVKIETYSNEEKSESQYNIKVKATNILAVCDFPPRQKGETFLFNDKNLWVYRPNLKKPISISSRQKLSGQTANGDIAAINYSKDYEATYISEEKVNGTLAAKLLLKAKSTDSTYDKINYWIELKSGLAVKAEYLNSDNTPIKTALFFYENQFHGVPFISKMEIIDSQFSNNKSILIYENIIEENLNDSIFNVNNLSR